MHERIHRFGVEGMLDDSSIPRLRAEYERLLLQDMEEEGYVPVLDLGTHWSTEYLSDSAKFQFRLTIYGIRVGREKACTLEGISQGKLIPRSIPQDKSPPCSESAE